MCWSAVKNLLTHTLTPLACWPCNIACNAVCIKMCMPHVCAVHWCTGILYHALISKKAKAFQYSILSVGPGADPGVQAVSLQVTISHPSGGRLPLLSARPAVTSPATEHHCPLAGTKLYCLVTEAHRCEQLAQGCCAALPWVGLEPATYWSWDQHSTQTLKFNSHNMETYNIPFSIDELLEALSSSNDSAVGPDDIHYQMLKHLPSEVLNTLLSIRNDIWLTGNFPSSWRQSYVVPIPKPGKDNGPYKLSPHCSHQLWLTVHTREDLQADGRYHRTYVLIL